MTPAMLRFAFAALLALSATLAAAQTAQPANGRMRPVVDYTYTESGFKTFDGRALSAQDVQSAIRRGATIARWKLEPAGPGHMTATHKDDEEMAAVDIDYDAQHFTISYKDSANLYYRTTETLGYIDAGGHLAPPGTKLIHNEYVEWVDDLKNTIRLELEN